MPVPARACRQRQGVGDVVLALNEQRRDGVAVVEGRKGARPIAIGLERRAGEPGRAARRAAERGFDKAGPVVVALERLAEAMAVRLSYAGRAKIERADAVERRLGVEPQVEPLAALRLHEGRFIGHRAARHRAALAPLGHRAEGEQCSGACRTFPE